MVKVKPTILLFDDDPGLVKLYENVFEEAGYSFLVTDNINKAIKLCREVKVDLVLANMLLINDKQTNERMGFVLLKTLKTLQKTKDIPVIIFTNQIQDENKEKAFDLKADNFLPKSSFTPSQMVRRVERILKAEIDDFN